jgi:hypothetical protein
MLHHRAFSGIFLYENHSRFVPLKLQLDRKLKYIVGHLMIQLREKTQNFFEI